MKDYRATNIPINTIQNFLNDNKSYEGLITTGEFRSNY